MVGATAHHLLELGALALAVALCGALADRYGHSVVPVYILAGVVLGPHVPTRVFGLPVDVVTDTALVHHFGELGLVLLLFFLGLHVDVEDLLASGPRLLAASGLDLLVNAALGFGVAYALGLGVLPAVFVAGVVYISSSAIVTKSLVDSGWIANPETDPILGTLVVEDVIIAVYLTVLTAVATGSGGLGHALVKLGLGVALLAAVALVGWYATGHVERAFAVPDDELFLLRVLGVVCLVGGVALVAGVSEGVAAFFVGAALGRTGHAERVERVLHPVRDFLAALFFVGVGLEADLSALGDVTGLLAAAVVVSIAGKLLSGGLSGYLYGLDRRRALRVGVGLVPRGEFSLVLAALAADAGGQVARVVPGFAVVYVLVMSVLGTACIRYAPTLLDALPGAGERRVGASAPSDD